MINPQLIPARLSAELSEKWKQYILKKADVQDPQALHNLLSAHTNKDFRAPLSRFLNGHGDEVYKWLKPNDKGTALLGIIECRVEELALAFMQLLPSASQQISDLTGFPLPEMEEDDQRVQHRTERLLRQIHEMRAGEQNKKLKPLGHAHFTAWFEYLNAQDDITSKQKRYLDRIFGNHPRLLSLLSRSDTDFLLLTINWALKHQPDHLNTADLQDLQHTHTYEQLVHGVYDEDLIEMLPQLKPFFKDWLARCHGDFHAIDTGHIETFLNNLIQPPQHVPFEEIHQLIHELEPEALARALKQRFPKSTNAKVLMRAMFHYKWLTPNFSEPTLPVIFEVDNPNQQQPTEFNQIKYFGFSAHLRKYAMYLLGEDFELDWIKYKAPPTEAFEVMLSRANKAQLKNIIEHVFEALYHQLKFDAFEQLALNITQRPVHWLMHNPQQPPLLTVPPQHSASWHLVDMAAIILFERHQSLDQPTLHKLWATVAWVEPLGIRHRYTHHGPFDQLSAHLKTRLPTLDTSQIHTLSSLVDPRILDMMPTPPGRQNFTPARDYLDYGRAQNTEQMWRRLHAHWPYQFAPQFTEDTDTTFNFINLPIKQLEHHAQHGALFAQLLLLGRHDSPIELDLAIQWLHNLSQEEHGPWQIMLANNQHLEHVYEYDIHESTQPIQIRSELDSYQDHTWRGRLSRWITRALEQAAKTPNVGRIDKLRDLLQTSWFYDHQISNTMELVDELEHISEDTPFWYKVRLAQHNPHHIVSLAHIHQQNQALAQLRHFLANQQRFSIQDFPLKQRHYRRYTVDFSCIDEIFRFNGALAIALNRHGHPDLLMDIWDERQCYQDPNIHIRNKQANLINKLLKALNQHTPPPPIPDEVWEMFSTQYGDLNFIHGLNRKQLYANDWLRIGQHVLPEYRWWFVIDELTSLDNTDPLWDLLEDHFEVDDALLPDKVWEDHQRQLKRRDLAIEQNEDITHMWLKQRNAHSSQPDEASEFGVSNFLQDRPQLASKHFEHLNAQTQRMVLNDLKKSNDVWLARAKQHLDYWKLEQFAKKHHQLDQIKGEALIQIESLETQQDRIRFWLNRQSRMTLTPTIKQDMIWFVTHSDFSSKATCWDFYYPSDEHIAWSLQTMHTIWDNYPAQYQHLVEKLLNKHQSELLKHIKAIGENIHPIIKCVNDDTDAMDILEHIKELFELDHNPSRYPHTHLKQRLKNWLRFDAKDYYPLDVWLYRLMNTPTQYHQIYRRSLRVIKDRNARSLLECALKLNLD